MIGKRIYEVRVEKQMGRKYIAQEAQMSDQNFLNIEEGRTIPTDRQLHAIARALEVNVIELTRHRADEQLADPDDQHANSSLSLG